MTGAERGRLRRLAAAAGAFAGVTSLAGCQTLGDGSDGQSGEDVGDGTGGVGGEGDADDDGPVGGSGDATPTESCETRRSRLETELSEVDERWETEREQLDLAEVSLAEWQARRAELPDGHPDASVEAARALGERVRESVVYLEIGMGSATGWFVDDGLVLTNAHNLFDAGLGESKGSATGYALDGSELDFEVVGLVESNVPDVALLRTGASRPALPLSASPELEPGTPLLQVGHPGGVGNWVVSLGLHVERSGGGDASGGPGAPTGPVSPTLKTSIPGRVGNSGSPIITLDGEVVGMTTASETRGLGATTGLAVAEPVVYDWPVAPGAWTIGVPADVVRDTFEGWR